MSEPKINPPSWFKEKFKKKIEKLKTHLKFTRNWTEKSFFFFFNNTKPGSRFWKHLAFENPSKFAFFAFPKQTQKSKLERQMINRKGFREAGWFRGGELRRRRKRKPKHSKTLLFFFCSQFFFFSVNISQPHFVFASWASSSALFYSGVLVLSYLWLI